MDNNLDDDLDDATLNKWERRDAKELKRQLALDNRVSVRLIGKLSADGKPKKLKKSRRLKIR